MSETGKIKVLVVDDSAIVRKLLTDAISADPEIEVVGTAPDPYIARDKILALKPDVLTLDIEMPRMDGLTFLKKVMQYHPLPVIIISSLGQASCQIALDALRLGAVEVLAKPGGPYSVGELRANLSSKIRAAAAARISGARAQQQPVQAAAPTQAPRPATPGPEIAVAARHFDSQAVIAIGASTGGTEALKEVLMHLPADTPGIVITQHIPPVFSRAFASRLNEICPMEVKEAADGDVVAPGRALIAPGNFHMLLRKSADGYRVQVKDGPQVCYQRPSVDVMFSSVADVAAPHTVAAILTGMGADGAQGMLKLKRSGAATIAQDEASCVVFGMPREAIRLGGVDRVVPLSHVAGAILSQLHAVRT
ncbi:MAG: chemotaxis response regulator protein-glutamate methylesterase [Acidobacteriaceae bacterium]|nr:chemotaxis response regulator protein-glutamate methylesterase [Acidobacteriaceae bacterium]